MKKSAVLVAMFMAVALAGSALAHGVRPEHGGVVRAADNLQFELVNKNGAAAIYVSENHGKAFSTAGASGTLTVTNGEAKTEVPLQPVSANAMETRDDAKLVTGAKATAVITFADKKVVTVNFVSK